MDRKAVLEPFIPTQIIVHLGKPDENSRNIRIPFINYIKNVACSEIYPTWPENALRANIIAIITFTLNRIYNEWYPSKGYSFDITSLSSYDQTFVDGRTLFESITHIVDEVFNNYVVKDGQIQPYFTKYCDGKKTICEGLSQWGTVTLAKQGKTTLQILKYYYGDDIKIITDTKTIDPIYSYPGVTLNLGDAREEIRIIQRELNAIHQNYPLLPVIDPVNLFFTVETENTVKKFQEIFNLPITGTIDKATWYKIKYIYNSVKKVNDLYTEGIQLEEVEIKYSTELKHGDSGAEVQVLHYFLGVISFFDDDLPLLSVNSIYTDSTVQMINNFQKKYNLEETGITDRNTWNKILEVYQTTIKNIPTSYKEYINEIYPGRFLSLGMSGDDVKVLQNFLFKICSKFHTIPGVRVTGTFDELTERSIKVLENRFNHEVNGIVGPVTWQKIVDYSKEEI